MDDKIGFTQSGDRAVSRTVLDIMRVPELKDFHPPHRDPTDEEVQNYHKYMAQWHCDRIVKP